MNIYCTCVVVHYKVKIIYNKLAEYKLLKTDVHITAAEMLFQ